MPRHGACASSRRVEMTTIIEGIAERIGRVSYADLSGLVDLTSTEATFDGMHLKPGANAAVAAALVDHVVKVSSKS